MLSIYLCQFDIILCQFNIILCQFDTLWPLGPIRAGWQPAVLSCPTPFRVGTPQSPSSAPFGGRGWGLSVCLTTDHRCHRNCDKVYGGWLSQLGWLGQPKEPASPGSRNSPVLILGRTQHHKTVQWNWWCCKCSAVEVMSNIDMDMCVAPKFFATALIKDQGWSQVGLP